MKVFLFKEIGISFSAVNSQTSQTENDKPLFVNLTLFANDDFSSPTFFISICLVRNVSKLKILNRQLTEFSCWFYFRLVLISGFKNVLMCLKEPKTTRNEHVLMSH